MISQKVTKITNSIEITEFANSSKFRYSLNNIRPGPVLLTEFARISKFHQIQKITHSIKFRLSSKNIRLGPMISLKSLKLVDSIEIHKILEFHKIAVKFEKHTAGAYGFTKIRKISKFH